MSYLDRISITRIAPDVLEVMLPLMHNQIGNPQSPHRLGSQSMKIVEKAREQTAALIGAQPKDILFTSNGTESNNLAILGLARAAAKRKPGGKIVVSAIEHNSIMKTAQFLSREGFQLEVIPVDASGHVERESFSRSLDASTLLVAIQLANPVVGTIQDVSALSRIAAEKGIPFHTDAVAAAGWMPIDVESLGVDALSLSGSTFHGPLGGAALYLKRAVSFQPQTFGGIQERNRRPGTENVPAIAGLGAAAELAVREIPERVQRGRAFNRTLRQELAVIEDLVLTGPENDRLPGHVSMLVNFVEGEALLLMLDMKGISAASGSSCTARDLKISPVLTALGLDHWSAQGSLVFSMSRDTTVSDAEEAVRALPDIVTKLRAMSPLWSQRRNPSQA